MGEFNLPDVRCDAARERRQYRLLIVAQQAEAVQGQSHGFGIHSRLVTIGMRYGVRDVMDAGVL